MTFDQLAVLLPCYSLESLDLQQKEEEAEQLLSAWSVLWHPALLAGARSLPRWLPAGSPPQEPSGCLAILPDCAEPSLPEGWLAGADAAGACILRKLRNRDEMLTAVLAQLGDDCPQVDPELAADFMALGFCHFQVEVMTRKLRYMSNLDEAALKTAVLAATDEAVRGDVPAARQHLQSAFDRLHEAREYFYPTAARLLDLTLVAPTTLGPALQGELGEAGGLRRNLLISGEVVERMAEQEPATLEALKRALAEKRAMVIGGEQVEIPLPLLGPEAIEEHLRRGLDIYAKHLGCRPTTFGRRRFGLTPALPRVLERTGFTGVLHCTLDDGQFPTGGQSRIEWEGFGGTTIAAIGCLPLDAGRSEVFLRLAETLSNAMNLDQTSAVMFAHWPGRACRWYDDLRRIASYGTVFGNFLSVDEYFEQTSAAGQRAHYSSDKYRSPYLVQDVTAGRRDPISRWTRYFTRHAKLETISAVETLASACGASAPATNDEQLAFAVEDSLHATEEAAGLDDRLARAVQKPLDDLAQALTGRGATSERGLLTVNPHSHAQQASILRPSSRDCPLTVETPAMGFAWIRSDTEPSRVIEQKGWFGRRKLLEMPPLAEENVLRNEFFEIRFDPQLGSIRTISDYSSRDPRLAQQIALRLPHGGEPGSDQNYSIMAADSLQVTSAGPVLGEMLSRGRLLDREGRRVAGFCQTTRVRRGNRVIEVEIELDADRQPGLNPWDSYYAVRFAWKDETAKLHRGVSMADLPTELTQFESPHFVDICRKKQRTTLLCGGLPFHRRLGLRMLDTLLAVQGETARSFRFGIGIDVPNPASAALAFLAPPLVLANQPSPPSATGWLFHLDCRNVVATHWQWLPASDADEQGPGFRVRLLETEGSGVRLGLRCFRKVASAREIDKSGAPSTNLTVNGDRIDVPVGPHEWIEVEGRF